MAINRAVGLADLQPDHLLQTLGSSLRPGIALANPRRPVARLRRVWTFRYLHHITRPLPLTGEDFRRGSPVTVQTRFGTLSAGLRTLHTARGKHARVGTGRNMPGNPSESGPFGLGPECSPGAGL